MSLESGSGEEKLTRREALGLLLVAVGGITSATLAFGRDDAPDAVVQDGDIEEELARVNCSSREAVRGAMEIAPDVVSIPEFQRKGSDFFVVLNSLDSQNLAEIFDEKWEKIFRAFPNNATVHVAMPRYSADDFFNIFSVKFPNLGLNIYSFVTGSGKGIGAEFYAQDMMIATGNRDKDGRFEILTSSLDEKYADTGNDYLYVRTQLDNVLVEKFPKIFKSLGNLPIANDGGDIEISILPDGRKALILGTSSAMTLVAKYAKSLSGIPDFYTACKRALICVKEQHKTTFGVDEVFIPDEETIMKLLKNRIPSLHDNLSDFYHLDMVAKTAISIAYWVTAGPLLTSTTRALMPKLSRVRSIIAADSFTSPRSALVPEKSVRIESGGYCHMVCWSPGWLAMIGEGS